MNVKDRVKLLDDWDSLAVYLKNATEEEALELLEHEKAQRKRRTTLGRIHARYNLMRGRREKMELVG